MCARGENSVTSVRERGANAPAIKSSLRPAEVQRGSRSARDALSFDPMKVSSALHFALLMAGACGSQSRERIAPADAPTVVAQPAVAELHVGDAHAPLSSFYEAKLSVDVSDKGVFGVVGDAVLAESDAELFFVPLNGGPATHSPAPGIGHLRRSRMAGRLLVEAVGEMPGETHLAVADLDSRKPLFDIPTPSDFEWRVPQSFSKTAFDAAFSMGHLVIRQYDQESGCTNALLRSFTLDGKEVFRRSSCVQGGFRVMRDRIIVWGTEGKNANTGVEAFDLNGAPAWSWQRASELEYASLRPHAFLTADAELLSQLPVSKNGVVDNLELEVRVHDIQTGREVPISVGETRNAYVLDFDKDSVLMERRSAMSTTPSLSLIDRKTGKPVWTVVLPCFHDAQLSSDAVITIACSTAKEVALTVLDRIDGHQTWTGIPYEYNDIVSYMEPIMDAQRRLLGVELHRLGATSYVLRGKPFSSH